MRKHLKLFTSTCIMAFFLLIICIPLKVHAAEVNASCPNYSFTAMDGSIVTNSTNAGKTKLIIFFKNGTSPNSNISSLANCSWISNPDLSVIAVEFNGVTQTELKKIADTYGSGSKNITFCSAKNNSVMWQLLSAAGYTSNTTTIPVSFIIDSNGYIRNYITGSATEVIYRNALSKYVSGLGTEPSTNVSVTGTFHYDEAYKVLELVNTHRKENGVSPLSMNTALLNAAMQRAAECSLYYSHTRPDGTNRNALLNNITSAENIAAGYLNAAAVMNAWMNSDGHRANILNKSYDSIGIGVFYQNGSTYWVQLFSSDCGKDVPTNTGTTQGTATFEILDTYLDLTVSPASIKLDAGNSAALTVSAGNTTFYGRLTQLDVRCLKFTSDNATVATVNANGVVTAHKSGKANITVSMSTGKKSISVPVTVTGTAVNTAAITKQPANANAASGKVVKTSLTATGDGLKYQWYIKNSSSTSYSKSSVTSATYSCTMSSASSGRMIYCVVTDKYGNSVKSGTATLGMSVSISKQPANASAVSGKVVKTSVTATGDGLKYQWYIKNSSSTSYSKSSITSATYSCTMSSASSGRMIYCVVTDKYGNSVKSNTVTLSMK